MAAGLVAGCDVVLHNFSGTLGSRDVDGASLILLRHPDIRFLLHTFGELPSLGTFFI